MKIQKLSDLFLHTLQDIYYAEKHIVKALPKMIENSDSGELSKAFEHHLAQTEEHVTRLEQVFKMVDQKPKASSARPSTESWTKLRSLWARSKTPIPAMRQ